MTEFQSALLSWYSSNARDLPWRKATHADPYAVWVSEAMLQQTTVTAVIPYFTRWMQRFPTLDSLATADDAQVLGYWQGLGYYSRCRNLLAAARTVQMYGWPTTLEGWRALPGVGDYTAAAVASIAQKLPAALVDGNVERVYARMTCDLAINPKLKANAWIWAKENLRASDSGDWNQALMELGATICTPKSPQCGICPVSRYCQAFIAGRVNEFPAPKPPKQWVEVSHQAWVFQHEGQFGLVQAKPGEWWSGLWHSPRGTEGELVAQYGDLERKQLGLIKHVVTKHKIMVEVFRVSADHPGLRWFSPQELDTLPISAPGRKILTLAQAQVQPRLELE